MHDNHVSGTSSTPGGRVRDRHLGTDGDAHVELRRLLNQSTTFGSVRRQPDGNTVIGWGAAWNPWLEEVTPDKQTRAHGARRRAGAPSTAW